MIRSFRNKALRLFWENGNAKGLIQEHTSKIDRILTVLDAASKPENMMLPGFLTHPLKGERAGTWASTVRANWRITYSFDAGDAVDVDYEDYH
jgi:proteic killer suppression protein